MATKIETGPYAFGEWKLVEYDCPKDIQHCVNSGLLSSACAGSDCPSREIGTVYAFQDGCLLGEPSINCVEGTQYGKGNENCESFPYIGSNTAIRLSINTGEYEEESNRWRIIERTCITDTTLPPGTSSPCTTGELLFERATPHTEM